MKLVKENEQMFYYSVDAYSLPKPQALALAKELRGEGQRAKIEKNGKLFNVVVKFECWQDTNIIRLISRL